MCREIHTSTELWVNTVCSTNHVTITEPRILHLAWTMMMLHDQPNRMHAIRFPLERDPTSFFSTPNESPSAGLFLYRYRYPVCCRQDEHPPCLVFAVFLREACIRENTAHITSAPFATTIYEFCHTHQPNFFHAEQFVKLLHHERHTTFSHGQFPGQLTNCPFQEHKVSFSRSTSVEKTVH